jgi:hypothetical protein
MTQPRWREVSKGSTPSTTRTGSDSSEAGRPSPTPSPTRERCSRQLGVPFAIVRPAFFFGGGRDILTNNIAWILRRMPLFVVPGDGRYLVQPIHVDDLAGICIRAAHGRGGVIMDAAGPDTMSFEELVRAIRDALGRRTPILHAPPAAMAALARALGLVVRDVVLTADEIRGLTAGLLVSHQPALGNISFLEWLNEHRPKLGVSYANELDRHFRRRRGI